MVVTVILLLAAVSMKELMAIFRKKDWKMMLVYSVLMLLSSGLLIAIMLEIPIPSPYFVIASLFNGISRVVLPTE